MSSSHAPFDAIPAPTPPTRRQRLSLTLFLCIVLLVGGAAVGWPMLRQVLMVGTGYAAKRLCSEVYVAGRPAQDVWREDLALLPTPILSYELDDAQKIASVSGLGMITQRGVWRRGLGCALDTGTTLEALHEQAIEQPAPPVVDEALPWPRGEQVSQALPAGVDRAKLDEALDYAFSEPDAAHPTWLTRAVVVVYDGQIVAERYAPGFSASTPLLSWSMAKSVTNAMIGVLVREGKLDIHQPAPVPEWQSEDDPRRAITTDALLRMSSGLGFDETYGPFGEATDMLFVSHDAAARAAQSHLVGEIGSRWSYSSADTNLLSRIVRQVIDDDAVYHRFPTKEIFHPIGARSALFETDPSGTFVGSSFVYMTARDWARFGLLYLQDGVWQGERILPEGWVKYSCTPTANTPQGEYGAQLWLNRGNPAGSENRMYPHVPADMCGAQGFETQRVLFIPSRKAVIVRLGLTRTAGDFPTDTFVSRVLEALPGE